MGTLWRLHADLITRTEGGGYLSDEPYSNREDEHTSLERVNVYATPMEEEELVKLLERDAKDSITQSVCEATTASRGTAGPGTTVYAVVVRTSSGDTFGNEYGIATALDIFTEAEQAEALCAAVEESAKRGSHAVNGVDPSWQLEVNGRGYYKNWVGYFDDFENVEIHTCVVDGQKSEGTARWYR